MPATPPPFEQIMREYAEAEAPKTFKPTPAMCRCKANLHRACSPSSVTALTPGDRNLPRYIAPTPVTQIRMWLEKFGEDFWEWLVTPPTQDGFELQARELALQALQRIFESNVVGEDGELNVLKARLQLDAAKVILASRTPLVAIQNNNNSVDSEKLPPGLRSKTENQLESRYQSITRHLPASQVAVDAEVAEEEPQA
jgi:hypothetical protein